jgi:histidine ammonia-lyase
VSDSHSARQYGDADEIVLRKGTLNLQMLARVARDPRIRVAWDADSTRRVEEAYQVVMELFEAQQDSGEHTPHETAEYGITTGIGEFKNVRIHPKDQIDMQKNLIRSHATGVGECPDPSAPSNYFQADVIRATLLVRLNTFIRGNSGVSISLVEAIAAMLNNGVIPLVPIRGSVGSSGDLCPLAHLFSVLLGEGSFYIVRSPDDVRAPTLGEIIPGSEIGEILGSAYTSAIFGPKTGLALINGAAVSAALLALAVHDAERLADAADVAVSLTAEAICACTRAFEPAVHEARPFPGQITSARNIRQLTAGSAHLDTSGEVQDSYSVRCAPQVHGASRDAINYCRRIIEIEINSSTDNPLVFAQREGSTRDSVTNGRRSNRTKTYSAGNFHGQPVALAADFLALALAEIANISERRTQMLLDRHHSRGLPRNLTTDAGLYSGMMISQYAAASLVSENKVLSHPASVDSIPTSANTEDHVSMATIAARKARTILSNSEAVISIELMVAAQAIEWRASINDSSDFPSAEASERLGAGTRAAYETIRSIVAPLMEDRRLDADIASIWRLVQSSHLSVLLAEIPGSPAQER